MRYQAKTTDGTIRGSCSLFVCRCCRTKYGWRHQSWCDIGNLTEPSCADCRYFGKKENECRHPANKKEGRTPYEEDDCPI